jgi:hypothetical protein
MAADRAGATFIQGLTRPSIPSVIAAALVVATVFASTLLLVTPRLIASDAIRYFASGRTDYDAFVTSRVLALGRSRDERPLVALVGASVTRMAFGTEAEIAEAIHDATGVDVEARLLCTGRQNLLEQATIVEELLALDRPVLVVVGIGPGRFNWTPAALARTHREPRLGFRSAASDREAARLGLAPFDATGNYFLDNRGFLLPRMRYVLASALVRGPRSVAENRYTGRYQDPGTYARHGEKILERFESFEDGFDVNAGILRRLLERVATAPGKQAFLVEEAINPDFLRDYLGEGFYEGYLQRTEALADALDVPHWTLSRDAGLGAETYFDWAHINSLGARAEMRALLAKNLGPYLR